MIKYILTAVIILHGAIHLMGFVKAFHFAEINQLTLPISRPAGIFWLITSLLFIVSALIFISGKDWWIYTGAAAVVISQVLIISSWHDAKYGTAANLIIIAALIIAWGFIRFEADFRRDAAETIKASSDTKSDILTEDAISDLPLPVQKYLRFTGSVGKPVPRNMKVVFTGKMREKGKEYFGFESVQYSTFNPHSRLFFMKAQMYGMTVPGYHRYRDETAVMNIRIFGLIPVVYHSGEVMNKTETVTLFNDICLMAPAALINQDIKWEEIDSLTAKAVFTNGKITISAILFFNENGSLKDFKSFDRTDIGRMKELPFTTPVHKYADVNGRKVVSEGDAVWHYDEGAFTYGRFFLKEIEYNTPIP